MSDTKPRHSQRPEPEPPQMPSREALGWSVVILFWMLAPAVLWFVYRTVIG